MIEFNGQMSKKCKRYIQQIEARHGLVAGLFGVLLGIVPICIILIFLCHIKWYLIVPGGTIFAIMFLILCYASPFMKGTAPSIIPTKIVITDDGYITSHGENFHLTEPIETVVVVVDMGEWYHVSWSAKPRMCRFVCQKDLLVYGTIEQFETLFAGKIIRATLK